MNRILLIAGREFHQIVKTRAFWVALLIMPMIFGLSIGVQRYFRPSTTWAYAIVDETGNAAPAIEHRLNLDYGRQVLASLSSYAKRWKIDAGGAVWGSGRAWFSDAEIDAFLKGGGVDAALAKIKPQLAQGTPVFSPPPPVYIRVDPPIAADEGAETFGAKLAPYLQKDVVTKEGSIPFAAVVYIPKGPVQPVRIWTNGNAVPILIDTVRGELTRNARLSAMAQNGVLAPAAAQIESYNVPIDLRVPPAGSARSQILIRSALPLALAYLLLLTTIVTGARMLTGVIEERANKLLESILACVKPSELMAGKLIGLGGTGLTVIAAWIGCAVAAGLYFAGSIGDVAQPAMASINQPWMYGAMAFYFVAGYLIISMMYLAIGSISNSMQDANTYLMPVTMGTMVPVILMINMVLTNPANPLPRIMSWIPVYTPFAMLARLGTGVSLFEVLGTGVLLAVFVVVEFILLGRVFQANLLNTGQPPKFGEFVRLMFQTARD